MLDETQRPPSSLIMMIAPVDEMLSSYLDPHQKKDYDPEDFELLRHFIFGVDRYRAKAEARGVAADEARALKFEKAEQLKGGQAEELMLAFGEIDAAVERRVRDAGVAAVALAREALEADPELREAAIHMAITARAELDEMMRGT